MCLTVLIIIEKYKHFLIVLRYGSSFFVKLSIFKLKCLVVIIFFNVSYNPKALY